MNGLSGDKNLLYEQVAERVAALVEQGTFQPGDRIPSVRGLSRQLKVSPSTVLEAYALLEDRGVVAVRPQSGYYVCPKRPAPLRLPAGDRELLRPTNVDNSELALMIYRDAGDPAFVQLGAAIPDLDNLPVDRLNRMLSSETRRFGGQSLSYERPAGNPRLRQQIARRMLTAGCSFSPDDLLVTNGCTEAVELALRAVCRPGDTVVVESPTFFNTLQAIAALDLKTLEIPADPQHGVNLDTLRFVLENNRVNACLFITNFSNPLGSVMPDDAKRELVRLLARHDLPLIEDDIYGDLPLGPSRPTVAKAYDPDGRVLLCSSFSKTIAPGYRVGWIAPGRYRAEVERLKAVTSLTNAVPPQLAIAEFLANGGYEAHLRRLRRIYGRQLALITQAVSEQFPAGTRVSRPEGGFVLWVEMPESVDSVQLYEMARERGITFAPGPVFSARPGTYRNYLRLSAAFWSDRVAAGIALLGNLAGKLQRR
ncbi:aminotransferase-like domain-containing protein [Geomesophilobacter sediminis]|uniref:PLP-dependent aminotransferase family protein n=1 Tax=Geomesophilobacter sediminis TaxID=2798584 RepID=A0A8J7IQ04_9BACT|nr:PLP-dependent aminotransferase family protein [Geomesophilobacter sediminis]MBJ6724594.1 PLP-dependent aminotransferase family protein [Geomesophilobacter sediminis]